MNLSIPRQPDFAWTGIPIGRFASKCSSAMAGDANDAEVPKIFRFIICSREAFWEGMWKRISSPFAVRAIGKSISISSRWRGSRGARDKVNDVS